MKLFARSLLFGMVAGLSLVSAFKTVDAYSVSASPNPCNVSPGQTTCSTTIQWNADEIPVGQVWVYTDDGRDQFFACGHDGTQVVPWIEGGKRYIFSLYESDDCSPNTRRGGIAGTTVRGIPAPPVFSGPFTADGKVGQNFSLGLSASGSQIGRASCRERV